MSDHRSGTAHRCAMHGLPNCSRRHQSVPYVRHEHPNQRSGEWTPATSRVVLSRWESANPLARVLVLVGLVLLLTAAIVLASVYAGDAAADGFGPLIPATPSTPSPTPFPGGWSPDAS